MGKCFQLMTFQLDFHDDLHSDPASYLHHKLVIYGEVFMQSINLGPRAGHIKKCKKCHILSTKIALPLLAKFNEHAWLYVHLRQ